MFGDLRYFTLKHADCDWVSFAGKVFNVTRGTVKKTNHMLNFFTPNQRPRFNFFTPNQRPRFNLGPLNINSVFLSFYFYFFFLLGFYLTIDFWLNLYNSNISCSNLEHIKFYQMYLFIIIIDSIIIIVGFYIYYQNNITKNIQNLLKKSMLIVLTSIAILVGSIIDYYLTGLILLDPKITFFWILEVILYKLDWKDIINIVINGKYLFRFLGGLAICFSLIIYRENIKNFFNIIYSPIALIKIGFYYCNKRDNSYFCNLISNINKKYLGLKKKTSEGLDKINPDDIRKDLYSSSHKGSLYKFRGIKGYLSRSILFYLIKKTHWITGLFLFLNRTPNLNINLNEYTNYSVFWFDKLSILDIMEFIFIIGTISKIFEILLDLWVIPDKKSSVFNPNYPIFYLGLSRNQKIYFHLGVFLSGLLALLGVLSKLIFIYLILCQINLISPYIMTYSIFEFIAYILDNIFKFYESEVEVEQNPSSSFKLFFSFAFLFIILPFIYVIKSE